MRIRTAVASIGARPPYRSAFCFGLQMLCHRHVLIAPQGEPASHDMSNRAGAAGSIAALAARPPFIKGFRLWFGPVLHWSLIVMDVRGTVHWGLRYTIDNLNVFRVEVLGPGIPHRAVDSARAHVPSVRGAGPHGSALHASTQFRWPRGRTVRARPRSGDGHVRGIPMSCQGALRYPLPVGQGA